MQSHHAIALRTQQIPDRVHYEREIPVERRVWWDCEQRKVQTCALINGWQHARTMHVCRHLIIRFRD